MVVNITQMMEVASYMWSGGSKICFTQEQINDFKLPTRIKGVENTEGWKWAQVLDLVFV
jgi:hypothetical protein